MRIVVRSPTDMDRIRVPPEEAAGTVYFRGHVQRPKPEMLKVIYASKAVAKLHPAAELNLC